MASKIYTHSYSPTQQPLYSLSNKISLYAFFPFNNIFFISFKSNDSGETSSQSSRSSNSSQTTVSLAKHGKLHSQLQMYAPLMHWLKATDHACYEKLLEVYTTSICKLYERDLRQFFDEARSKVIGLREKKRKEKYFYV
jgi:hypothetical protein